MAHLNHCQAFLLADQRFKLYLMSQYYVKVLNFPMPTSWEKSPAFPRIASKACMLRRVAHKMSVRETWLAHRMSSESKRHRKLYRDWSQSISSTRWIDKDMTQSWLKLRLSSKYFLLEQKNRLLAPFSFKRSLCSQMYMR